MLVPVDSGEHEVLVEEHSVPVDTGEHSHLSIVVEGHSHTVRIDLSARAVEDGVALQGGVVGIDLLESAVEDAVEGYKEIELQSFLEMVV